MSPTKYYGSGGSTGTIPFEQITRVFDRFLALAPGNQTSAGFSAIWDARATLFREDTFTVDYVVGGAEANSAQGWYEYYKRLVGSTRNTSSGGKFNVLGLPDELWRDFSTRIPIIGETTNDDASRGDHVYEVLMTTGYQLDGNSGQTDFPYQTGDGRGLLAAWAAAGATSVVGTS